MTLSTRWAVPDDWPAVALFRYESSLAHFEHIPEVFGHLPPRPMDEQSVTNWMAKHQLTVRLACAGPTPVGFCVLRCHQPDLPGFAPFGQIMDIFIAPAYRRQGLAGTLFADMRHHLATQGIHELVLDVYDYNQEAKRLYQRLGFIPIKQTLSLSF
ncbi:ribosomal protein S18 acetylase RimI-like enzyme [Chitinivorax tropicus]|uniref:Ribosomal protein S18 acetylase RimI-like enzyme n=1 Tax=Chitinivorax tropicus TaxID=714531 RepID=A0A840MKF4_9PROT|nr:GNAT family N-acetyltransferase [Chitinivorax tropicus]MBB5017046.1 ribosomal protein S18 acetylase RimI-like enzyme [Chitinivorax tropicus]